MNQYLEKYIRKRERKTKTNRGEKSFLKKLLPERTEGQSGEEYARKRMLWGLKYGVYALAMLAVLRGVLVTAKANISVSNSVNGKELPIYCVETNEPKVALTFDAAWGNEDTAKILEILKKHNVHVTFFMTGGWVENYPDDVRAILSAGACVIIMTLSYGEGVRQRTPSFGSISGLFTAYGGSGSIEISRATGCTA